MKATIEVKDRQEAKCIRAGLIDPMLRAFVTVVGILKGLPSDRMRKWVITSVADHIAENRETETP